MLLDSTGGTKIVIDAMEMNLANVLDFKIEQVRLNKTSTNWFVDYGRHEGKYGVHWNPNLREL